MTLLVVGVSHHDTPLAIRERLAFSNGQARAALAGWRDRFFGCEIVLLSTCNRTELYAASESDSEPGAEAIIEFLAGCHGLAREEVAEHLFCLEGEDAVRHLFTVAASLDSMVVGEAQILSQVKQAYQLATEERATGPLTHAAFQAAIKAARRVAGETTVHHRRVSIPSVAVADFAGQIFERFEDKSTLVIGAGEMAEETIRYLRDKGVRDIAVVNRSANRAAELADRWQGRAISWEDLDAAMVEADLVISTTGADEPVIAFDRFIGIEAAREQRPLFILDLAVPRDFDPEIAGRPDVYLYSIDDLSAACERNRKARDKQLPAAEKIIEQETARFMADLHHRAMGPIIRRLRQGWQKPKEEELQRLFNKLPDLDAHQQEEIRQAFERLVNKLLHPPLESLRDESRHGIPSALMDAISRLFQLKD
ncbi:MAG: glutamyl-tRNA reductase [Planctomycetaceae bacterium]|nr:glutamyl-tRNA reductase [Planctomycetaceae bacterium]